jgi:hypothetical protein
MHFTISASCRPLMSSSRITLPSNNFAKALSLGHQAHLVSHSCAVLIEDVLFMRVRPRMLLAHMGVW